MARFVRGVALWLVALCALACVGCGVRPLGTNDVAIVYRAKDPKEASGDALAAKVKARLAAAQITTDIEPTGDGVRVVVDRDEAGTVDELLAWRGGLAIYALASGAKTTEGSIDAVADAARDAKVGASERVLVERTGPATGRTRVVRTPALADLSDGVASVTSPDGKSLSVRLAPHAATKLEEVMQAFPGVDVVVARDRSALRVGPLEGEPIVLRFGDDLSAYARAKTTRLLLSTGALPALARASAEALPTNGALTAAALVVPFALSLAWLFFVRRFDRAHPEPWPLVAATFALGGVSVVPAALAEVGWTHVSEWTDPSLVTMGGRLAALPIALLVFALVVGLSEEGAKFLGAWSLAYHRREFDEPIDGLVYGAASALGFAAVENVKYFALGRFGAVLVVVRTFLSIPAHLFFGSIWGYALGRKLVVPRTKLLLFLALAALVHGAFDTFLSIDGTASLALLLNLGLASVFVLFLRRALRHGQITAESARVDPSRRVMVTVGSPIAFAACVIALHVFAAMIFVASTTIEGRHERVGLLFIGGMAWLIALLGVSAYGVSRTMPLDVVLDEHGVTYAGAARPWRAIRGLERTARAIHVHADGGDLWIGPAPDAVLDPVARAIASRIVRAAA